MSSARSVEGDVAERVVLSYRSVETGGDPDSPWVLADSDWIRERMEEPSYLRYLRRVHEGAVAVGDEWEEFVNCGCASPEDVVIRVEAVEGGDVLGEDTDIDVLPRREVLEA